MLLPGSPARGRVPRRRSPAPMLRGGLFRRLPAGFRLADRRAGFGIGILVVVADDAFRGTHGKDRTFLATNGNGDGAQCHRSLLLARIAPAIACQRPFCSPEAWPRSRWLSAESMWGGR